MSATQDYVALEWIRGELSNTLQNAQVALEAVAGSPDDAASMRSCLTAIHQVHGTLKMVQLEGPTQVASEMEQVAQSLMNNSVPELRAAQETLMQAILQLPAYLDRLHRDQKDSEGNYLPMVNNLRVARGEERIPGSEPAEGGEGSGPDLSPLTTAPGDDIINAFFQADGQGNLPKIRAKYQQSLGAILKKNNVRENLTTIGKLFTMLIRLCGKSPTGNLAELGLAAIESIANGVIKLDNNSATLLKKIDDHLKSLVEKGQDGLSDPVSEELATGMIALIQGAQKETKRITALKELYASEAPEPEEVAIGPDEETMSAVATILIEELNGVTDKLDLYVRAQNRNVDDLVSLLPNLEQIASTMVVLGNTEQQGTVTKQIEVIREIQQSGEPDEDVLLSMAQALLEIVASLGSLVMDGDDTGDGDSFASLDEAQAAVVRETRTGLSAAKDAVIDFISSDFDHGKLTDLPGNLRALRGGLMIVNQSRAGDVLASAANYVSMSLLANNATPPLEQMDDLADAVTSVDYFLERLLENAGDPYLQMLEVAETAVEKLGYPAGQEPVAPPAAMEEPSAEVEEPSAEIVEEPSAEVVEDPEVSAADALLEDDDLDLEQIFAIEADEKLEIIEAFVQNPEVSGDLVAAFHTLKGSSAMAEINSINAISAPMEHLANDYLIQNKPADDRLIESSRMAAGLIRKVLTDIDGLRESVQGTDALLALVSAGGEAEAEPEVTFDFQNIKLLSEANIAADGWQDVDALVAELRHALEQAESLNQPDLAALVNAMLRIYSEATEKPDDLTLSLMMRAHDHLVFMFDAIASSQPVRLAERVLNDLNAVDLAPAAELEAPAAELEEPAAEAEEPEAEAPAPAAAAAVTELPEDNIDEDILPIFLEETEELLEAIDESILGWSDSGEPGEHLDNLLRQLHTLKGGARMAGIASLGEYTHNFETFLIGIQQNPVELDDDFFTLLAKRQDEVIRRVEIYKALSVGAASEEDLASLKQAIEPTLEAEPSDSTEAPTAAAATPGPSPEAAEKPAPAQDKAASANQEMVRVAADLLEELIGLAGESSITRGRVEQQITDFGESLQEMEETINRIRDQVRRLEIEAESRETLIRTSQGDSSFDELEMDRYTMLQTISRALSEATSDMMDLKDTLGNRSRDAETLLHQQARISSELQEGLTRTSMVPFARLIPRLRRIVRQVSGEVGKSVRFDAYNVEGELDSNVLERIVAPLEHMLRNAVDHGIEDKEKRVEAGKPEQGRISLRLSREGGYVVLTISDDGGGINVEAVRGKAIERGIITEGQEVSDHEVMQFIMHAGFSTAQKLTQISGRGVGMDVVGSEIKALGGDITIDSTYGVGTEFQIRIPFTVSINRALMVVVREETYAVPLNTIEGIVRVSPYELEAYYQPDAPMFEYAGQPYRLAYMGKMLDKSEDPNLAGQVAPLPVILARSGDNAVALQVDRVIGSREVVVKTLGSQFSDVGGISGATVLGDGSVVIILDCMALVRSYEAAADAPAQVVEEEAPVRTSNVRTVMIVDDSVTVRKVTSRLMERHGYEVKTAKDGVDAMNQLQDIRPDVVLLDIEMPRMDGFEVLRSVRRDENLKDLPIIMITSRTGEKHKQQAMELGVNQYLGKPFQEANLLATIDEVIESAKSKPEG